jgi:anti-sigma-K factor RskA
MSVNGNTHDHDRGDDAAAYVLGALEPREAAEYLQHLTRCVRCREELAGLAPVADALASAVPQVPVPPELGRRVMRAVRDQPHGKAQRVDRQPRKPSRFPRPGFAPAAGIATACVVAILAFVAIHHGRDMARVVSARVMGSPGAAQLHISHNHAELVVSRLPPPPAGRIYEVWLKRGSTSPAPTSALFSVTANGAATVDVPGNLRGVSQILVTQEPAGGSRVSTHRPLIVASLT